MLKKSVAYITLDKLLIITDKPYKNIAEIGKIISNYSPNEK